MSLSNSIKQQLEAEFEKLPSFPSQTNFVPLMKEIYNGIKTVGSIDSFISTITLLRRINKYEGRLFIILFESFFPYIKQKFKDENNTIVRNILTLTYEICAFSDNAQLYIEYLKYIIKKVIKILSVQKDELIINISKEIMQVIFVRFYPHDVFDILIYLLKNKRKTVMLKTAEYSFEFFNRLDKNTLKYDLQWGNMFTILSFLIINYDEDIANRFYHGVKKMFTQDEWEEILCQATTKELGTLLYIDKIDIKKIEQKKKELYQD